MKNQCSSSCSCCIPFVLLLFSFIVSFTKSAVVISSSSQNNNRRNINTVTQHEDSIISSSNYMCDICDSSTAQQQQQKQQPNSIIVLSNLTIPPQDVIYSQMPTFFTKFNEISISKDDLLTCSNWQMIINDWLQKRCYQSSLSSETGRSNNQFCDEFCSIFQDWLKQSCCVVVQEEETTMSQAKANNKLDDDEIQFDNDIEEKNEHNNEHDEHHPCNICTVQDSKLLTTMIPPQLSSSERPIFLTNNILSTLNAVNMTCGEWQYYMDKEMNEKKEFCQSTDEQYCNDFCLQFENWLEYSCCEGGILLPKYQCQEIVRNSALISHDDGIPYDKVVPPLSGDYGTGIGVYVSVIIKEYKIVNYGVNGGAIEAKLTTTESWVDERLQWDPNDVGGCTQIHVHASLDPLESDIWVPGRGKVIKHDHSSSDATVLADGSVTWERQHQIQIDCKTVHDHVTKLCQFSFSSDEGGLYAEDGINYIVGNHYDLEGIYNNGVSVMKKSTLPGYLLNHNRTKLLSIPDLMSGGKELILNIHFDPLVTQCYLCGGIVGETLRSNKEPSNNNDGGYLALSPIVNGWTCGQIESYLSTSYTVNDTKCDLGREYFTEACCENIPSRNTCEQNIRTMILQKLKGDIIAPPDPSSSIQQHIDDGGHNNNNNNSSSSRSMIDVEVLLDFTHIIDIDIKLNTLEVLISLELFWHDDRLKWDPFVGGCSVASFKASIGDGNPEIWVPEIDLLDHVEGAQGLPDAAAVVFQDGLVWWKRTGVLIVACDLTGLRYFPFDSPSCNMDFGATRSPLAHRVNYTARHVEFSKHLEQRTGKYHEYHVMANNTIISTESEALPSYVNSFVRYTFFFERSFSYYLWTFIILYIFFTYLSFGMFFLDQRVGERLGFGTGMLFVIVAQDITIAERTPVSQLQLWINILSFVSKVYIIIGIVESIVILYFFFVNDLDDDELLQLECNNNNNNINDEWERLVSSSRDNNNNNQLQEQSRRLFDIDLEDDKDNNNHSSSNRQMRNHGKAGKVGGGGSVTFKIDTSSNNNNKKKVVRETFEMEPSSSDTDNMHKHNNNNNKRRNRRSEFSDKRNRQSMYRSFNDKLGRKASWWVLNCLGEGVDLENDSLMKQKLLKLRLWDRAVAYIFFITYTLFVIIMFFVANLQEDDH